MSRAHHTANSLRIPTIRADINIAILSTLSSSTTTTSPTTSSHSSVSTNPTTLPNSPTDSTASSGLKPLLLVDRVLGPQPVRRSLSLKRTRALQRKPSVHRLSTRKATLAHNRKQPTPPRPTTLPDRSIAGTHKKENKFRRVNTHAKPTHLYYTPEMEDTNPSYRRPHSSASTALIAGLRESPDTHAKSHPRPPFVVSFAVKAPPVKYHPEIESSDNAANAAQVKQLTVKPMRFMSPSPSASSIASSSSRPATVLERKPPLPPLTISSTSAPVEKRTIIPRSQGIPKGLGNVVAVKKPRTTQPAKPHPPQKPRRVQPPPTATPAPKRADTLKRNTSLSKPPPSRRHSQALTLTSESDETAVDSRVCSPTPASGSGSKFKAVVLEAQAARMAPPTPIVKDVIVTPSLPPAAAAAPTAVEPTVQPTRVISSSVASLHARIASLGGGGGQQDDSELKRVFNRRASGFFGSSPSIPASPVSTNPTGGSVSTNVAGTSSTSTTTGIETAVTGGTGGISAVRRALLKLNIPAIEDGAVVSRDARIQAEIEKLRAQKKVGIGRTSGQLADVVAASGSAVAGVNVTG